MSPLRWLVIILALVGGGLYLYRSNPNYDTAVNLILAEEGILSETVKYDKGGRTTLGIASAFWPVQEAKAYDLLVVKKDRAGAIAYAKSFYFTYFWVPSGANLLNNAPLAYMVFDTAVNQGVSAAIKSLAQSGGDPDKFSRSRADRYKAIILADPTQRVHARNWFTRNDRFRDLAGLPGIANQYLSGLA